MNESAPLLRLPHRRKPKLSLCYRKAASKGPICNIRIIVDTFDGFELFNVIANDVVVGDGEEKVLLRMGVGAVEECLKRMNHFNISYIRRIKKQDTLIR